MRILIGVVVLLLVAAYPFREAGARTLAIAVIDTGIDPSVPHQCKFGSRDFTVDQKDKKARKNATDVHGHGSHVSGLIVQQAGDSGYCIVALKYYSEANPGSVNLRNMKLAIQYAINIKVDYINISGGGPEADPGERSLIKKALDKGIKVVVAAGNDHDDLDKACVYFPACYDPRLVVVGNLEVFNDKTDRCPSSNYGKHVNRWEVGTDLKSTLVGGKTGSMTGTSQATAVATGKLVHAALNKPASGL